ncbi:hypothetical protein KIH74_33225, partial [Kineosporia sp. J2-2]
MGMLDWIRTPVIGPGPLGNGVWRRVHDRFARAVRRYRAVIDVVPSRPVRAELAEIAEDLDEILELVREACEHAQAAAPSEGPDVPVGPGDVYLDVHRRLARAATLCARSSESAMMTRVAVRMKDADGVRDHIDAARRTVKQVREMVEGAV